MELKAASVQSRPQPLTRPAAPAAPQGTGPTLPSDQVSLQGLSSNSALSPTPSAAAAPAVGPAPGPVPTAPVAEAVPTSLTMSEPAPAAAEPNATPPLVTRAQNMLSEAAQARQALGTEYFNTVLSRAPETFKAVLQACTPQLDAVATELGNQGVVCDPFYLLASEARKLTQAGINAELRAEFREQQGQTADRAALLREELTYQSQAEILMNAFPQVVGEVAQLPAEGEAQITARTFVDEMCRRIPADQAAQVQQMGGLSAVCQAAAANPALVDAAAASLPQVGGQLVAVSQDTANYFAAMGQVINQELQAAQLLSSLQG